MHSGRILSWLRKSALVPIVRAADAETALRVVDALAEGGLDCIEVTMTVDRALQVLETLADRQGDRMLLGAGTVLDPETARACMLAGAQFLVTPALNVKTIEMAKRYARPVFPGGLTPTEILTAWQSGADAVKVFPCNAVGGPKYIKSLKAPFPQIELFPTGGVNLETLPAYLAAGAMAAGAGGELVDSKLIAEKRFDLITERARQFRQAAARPA